MPLNNEEFQNLMLEAIRSMNAKMEDMHSDIQATREELSGQIRAVDHKVDVLGERVRAVEVKCE